MEIIRELSNDLNLNTELYNFLSAIPDTYLYNTEHNLKKPLGIFNTSSAKIFNALTNSINSFRESSKDYGKIRTNYIELLNSLMAFFDDSYHIMKCFYSADTVKKTSQYSSEWMEAAEPEIVKSFKDMIGDYKNKLSKIVNKIKHAHAEFTFVQMSTPLGGTLGYCILSADNSETLGPDPEIHPLYRGMSTSISFNKDIRYHLANYYLVSRALMKTINKILKKKYDIFIDPIKVGCSKTKQLIELFSNVCKMQHIFFEDEYNENLAQIEYDTNNNIFKIRYPASKQYLNKLPRYNTANIRYIFSGDGVTRSWKLPYFGGES